MPPNKGSAETINLLKAVLARYKSVPAAAESSNYSISYLYYLKHGQRTASQAFCAWVKSAHPDLRHLCAAVRESKIVE